MYCQDSVIKNNWDVERGEIYVIGPEGSMARRAYIETSVVIWPEKQIETTKRYLVVPITYDLQRRDPKTDKIFRDNQNTGRPFAVQLDHAHIVRGHRLLKYVGKINDKTTEIIAGELKRLFMQCCKSIGEKETK